MIAASVLLCSSFQVLNNLWKKHTEAFMVCVLFCNVISQYWREHNSTSALLKQNEEEAALKDKKGWSNIPVSPVVEMLSILWTFSSCQNKKDLFVPFDTLCFFSPFSFEVLWCQQPSLWRKLNSSHMQSVTCCIPTAHRKPPGHSFWWSCVPLPVLFSSVLCGVKGSEEVRRK